jgi:putative ABC transport system permease protein
MRRAFSLRLMQLAFTLLPPWFRQSVGRDLLVTHAERARECRTSFALVGMTVRELASIVTLAIRLRFLPSPVSTSRRPMFATLQQDIAFAARGFARRWTFSLLVVVTFGLGIGATTAMYSVVDAVLLRPIDAPEPERIASIYTTIAAWRTNERLSPFWDRSTFSWPGYVEYKKQQQSFADVAAYAASSTTITGDGAPELIGVGLATPELFSILGARPYLGRFFNADDPTTAVILAHDFWRARFGGDQNIIGREIKLGPRNCTVIGVLPPGFEMARHWRTSSVIDAPVWRPIVPTPNDNNYNADNSFLSVIGRLRVGVSIAQASDEAARLIPAVIQDRQYPRGGRVVPRIEDQSSAFRQPLLILIGATVLLLIAACTSVATMLLGAGMDRQAELAVRAALGAGRGRLVRQLVTEGAFLGIAGGVLGMVLASALLEFLLMMAPAGTPGLAGASLDARVLLVAFGVSIVFALLFTIAPALVLSRVNIAGIASNARSVAGTRGRLQQILIVGELTLATTLLVGAGLLTRTMHRLETVDPGFQPDGVLTVRVVQPPSVRFRIEGETGQRGVNERISAYYGQLAGALRAIPGVEDVAIASVLPFSGDASSNDIEPEGVIRKPGESWAADRRPISANYFDVMKMRIVTGRGFVDADDRPDALRVVVVNEGLVRKYWPGQSVVGKRLGFWNEQWTVIGVVRDTRELDLRGEPGAKFYVPSKRLGQQTGSFVIRTRVDPSTIMKSIRPTLWSIDGTLPITQIATMRERMGDSVVEQRYRMRLMLAISGLAIVFAITGVYGVLSRSVARRRRELGIRSALGAMKRDVMLLLLKQGLLLGVVGVGIGLVAGYFGTRVLESMLYETSRNDPLTLVAITVLVLGLTVIAAWYPARRAARVDPMEVLRAE